MAKVFKIGQDQRETEYLISLWMLILGRAEKEVRNGQCEEEDPSSIITHVKGLIRGTEFLTPSNISEPFRLHEEAHRERKGIH